MRASQSTARATSASAAPRICAGPCRWQARSRTGSCTRSSSRRGGSQRAGSGGAAGLTPAGGPPTTCSTRRRGAPRSPASCRSPPSRRPRWRRRCVRSRPCSAARRRRRSGSRTAESSYSTTAPTRSSTRAEASLSDSTGRSQETPSLPFTMEAVAAATSEQNRVLVVDDEPNIADVISMALRYQGFAVESAGTGGDALKAVSSFKPHLILLDVMLPDMEGFKVAQRLGAQRAHVPIIFLTARDATEDKVRGLTMGGDDYVTKPFSLEELIARIRTILRRT